MDKQEYISYKIKKLMSEGRPQSQAIAIAINMEKERDKMQAGGIYNNPQPFTPYQNPLFDNQFNFRPETNLNPTTDINLGGRQQLTPFSGQQMGMADLSTQAIPQANFINQNPQTEFNPTYRDTTKSQIYNPYTGVNLETALFTLGQSLGYEGENRGANTLRGIAAAGKIGLGGARTLLSGLGYQNRNQNSYNNYLEQLYNPQFSYTSYQEGGEVTNADVMTGAYIVDTPDMANVEIEKNEIVQDPITGDVRKAVGDTHENGGIKTALPSGSKILSDHTKIGAQKAKLFKKEFDIKVKPTDTFAKVMDKYNDKIGFTDLIDEEKKTIEQVGDQQQNEIPADTKDINMNFLSEKMQELQVGKELIKPLQDDAFNLIFEEQEKVPKSKQEDKMQEGGQTEYDENILALSQQYNLAPERIVELMQQANPAPQNADIQNQVVQALQQGAQPQQVLQQLMQSGMPQEQAQQLIDDSMQLSNAEVQGFQAGGTFFTPSQYALPTYGDQPFLTGTTTAAGIQSQEEVLARLQAQNQTLPYIVGQSGIYSDNAGAFPNLNNTGAFQQSYDQYVDATLSAVESNPYLTPEQKADYAKTATAQRLGISRKSGEYDKIYGQETSSRTGFTLPFLTQEDKAKYGNLRFIGDVVDETGQIKEEYKDLDPATKQLIQDTYQKNKQGSLNIGLGVVPVSQPQQQEVLVEGATPQVINRQTTTLSMPNVPVDFVLPPDPNDPVFKASVNLGTIDPVKLSIEPNLIEADRQRQSTIEALSYLPDSQRAAAISSLLGQTQTATNQAITATEQANAQAQYNADLYNTQARDKQQLLENQFTQQYEQNVFRGLSTGRQDLRNYFTTLNLQQRQNFADIRDLNLLNQLYPNFATTGQDVSFQNTGNIITPTTAQTRRTPAEQAIYAKKYAEEQARLDARKNKTK